MRAYCARFSCFGLLLVSLLPHCFNFPPPCSHCFAGTTIFFYNRSWWFFLYISDWFKLVWLQKPFLFFCAFLSCPSKCSWGGCRPPNPPPRDLNVDETTKGLSPLIWQKHVTNESFLVRSHIRNFQGFKIWFWKPPQGHPLDLAKKCHK